MSSDVAQVVQEGLASLRGLLPRWLLDLLDSELERASRYLADPDNVCFEVRGLGGGEVEARARCLGVEVRVRAHRDEPIGRVQERLWEALSWELGRGLAWVAERVREALKGLHP